MKPKYLILVCIIPVVLVRSEYSTRNFSKSFKFGIASAAYQTEGSWNVSGKGESNWDWYTHNTKIINDRGNGDIACDSYSQYKRDIHLLQQLGVDHYRFSISISRILPTGKVNNVNKLGVDHYNKVINALLAAGIEPWVTIYHWDMPRSWDYLGGWSNPLIKNYMTQYADLLFSLFGDRVKTWITINEPDSFCRLLPVLFALEDKYFKSIPFGISEYLCGHNVLKTHASIYHLYQNKYKENQGGRLSMALSFQNYKPAFNSRANIEAAERIKEFTFGWFAHPLIYGDYPPVMIKIIEQNSILQGFQQSRLPKFTEEEIDHIKGTYDFIGLNYYISVKVLDYKITSNSPSYFNDRGCLVYDDISYSDNYIKKVNIYAEGFGDVLRWINTSYNSPEIVILEEGYDNSEKDKLEDIDRVYFLQMNLNILLDCIEEGIKVTAYTVWSLLDDFEWISGYRPKLGLHHVDFNSTNRIVTPKASSKFYKELLRSRSLIDVRKS